MSHFDRNVRIGVVHAGRLGSSLAVALAEAGYSVAVVHRSDLAAAQAVARRIKGARPTDVAQDVVDESDVVFLTCVDRRLGQVAGRLRFRAEQAVLHCSGATPVSVLSSSSSTHGPLRGGIHPLQLFPDAYGEGRFRGITFSIEAEDEGLRRWLTEVVSRLGGRAVPITESERAVYHASATLVSPLLSGMVALAADLWQEMGRSREEALEALAPLIRATVEQIEHVGIPAAITGPFSRGDVSTVERHLEALKNVDTDVLRVYAALGLAQLPLAEEGREISVRDRLILEELLRSAAGL